MEIADVARIRAAYDHHPEQTRLVTLLSPTCTICQYGQGVVRGIFEEWEDLPLHGLVIWVPMLPADTAEKAEAEAAAFSDPRIEHFWDAERALAKAFSGVLDLRTVEVGCLVKRASWLASAREPRYTQPYRSLAGQTIRGKESWS